MYATRTRRHTIDAEQADRFATASLEEYAREEVFDISLFSLPELRLVADAFRRLGCGVRLNEVRLILTVDCRREIKPD